MLYHNIEYLVHPSHPWIMNCYRGTLIQETVPLEIDDVPLDDLVNVLFGYQTNDYVDAHISYEIYEDSLEVNIIYWRECTAEELVDLAARRAHLAQKAAQKELELLEREQKEYLRLKTKYEPHLLE